MAFRGSLCHRVGTSLRHRTIRPPALLCGASDLRFVSGRRYTRSTSSASIPTVSSSMELLVLGSGPSTSVPSIRCLVTNPDCPVCPEAHANLSSRNRRGNPSLLVKYQGVHILIDCGKTFRESLLRCLSPSEIPHPIDAVVLTHGHADACFGLDDLRDVQRRAPSTGLAPLPVYCSRRTSHDINAQFRYLFDAPDSTPSTSSTKPSTPLWTSKLHQVHFDDTGGVVPFAIQDTPFTFRALPVWHGADYIAHGFEFGHEIGRRVVYISDVSRLTEETQAHLRHGPPIDVLFLDALHVSQSHPTHMNLPEALAVVDLVKPRKAYLVGMGHSFDYPVHQAHLAALGASSGADVEMAFDGLRICIDKQT